MNKRSYERRAMNQDYTHQLDEEIEELKNVIPNEIIIDNVSELFRVFGDNTRLRILSVLFVKELCVCDIAKAVEMSQSSVSHQLRILKQLRLVKYYRSGKEVVYSLADEHIKTIFDQGIVHVGE